MPAVATVNEFVENLARSQLLNEELFGQVRSQLSQLEWLGDDPQKLALSLVQSKLLTNFQAQRLLAGFDAGFYLGKYKLLELLGRGGMGKVFLAEQTTMHRLVALKVIGRVIRNQDETLLRFAREAKAVAALNHPNIVQAHDFDQIDGIPFIAMEFVEGIDIEVLVENQKKIEIAQACEFIRQTCAGLHHAHQSGFVHRDIKPGNLLVDVHGTLKILDMGLVSRIDDQRNDSLTTRNDQIGTVDYMAPEQARDSHHVDRRVDLYSLGAVLHFMLSGQILFPGKSTAQKLLAHQSSEPIPLRQIDPEIPEELELIVQKMIRKNPDERYQTAAEVGVAIAKFAQAKHPPYDASLLRYSREVMAPYLGRAPEVGELNTPQMSTITKRPGSSPSANPAKSSDTAPVASADNQTDQSSGTSKKTSDSGKQSTVSPAAKGTGSDKSSSVSKVGPRSGIKGASGIKSKKAGSKSSTDDTALDDFDDFDDLPMDDFVPSASTKKLPKLGGKSSEKAGDKKKKKKGDSDGTPGWVIPAVAAGGLLVVGLVVGGVWMTMSGGGGGKPVKPVANTSKPGTSGTTASTGNTPAAKPNPVPATTPATQPAPPAANEVFNDLTKYGDANAKEANKRWLAFSNKLKKDKDLIAYYTFSGKNAEGETLVSDAENPKFGRINGKIDGAKWTAGRFPDKKALIFGGPKTDQRVAFSDGDSENMNFDKSFSVAVWFRVGEYHKDFGAWQSLITKGDSSWRLHRQDKTDFLALDATTSVAAGAQKVTKISGQTNVNDKKWHLAVGTFDMKTLPARMTLYVDGRADGAQNLEKLNPNKFAVSIGGNTEKRLTPTSESRAFNGLIDEVLIIHRALKPGEVDAYFENGKP